MKSPKGTCGMAHCNTQGPCCRGIRGLFHIQPIERQAESVMHMPQTSALISTGSVLDKQRCKEAHDGSILDLLQLHAFNGLPPGHLQPHNVRLGCSLLLRICLSCAAL